MKAKTNLFLVRNEALLYPLSDKDYEVLASLGVPINNVSAEFTPSLLTYLPSNIKASIKKFDEVEQEMLVRFKAKWKHEVSINAKTVVLTFPKNTEEEHLEKAMQALKKWYRNHFITLDAEEKRAGSQRRLILTKTLTPRREWGI